MGIRVSGPEVVAFLEWLRTSFPDVRAAADISEPTLHELAESFLSSHFEDTDDAYHALRNHRRQSGRWSLSPELHWLNRPLRFRRPRHRGHDLARDLILAINNPGNMSESWGKRYGRGASRVDLLSRYRTIPFRSIFLYTTQDRLFASYIKQHWSAWSDEFRRSIRLLRFFNPRSQTR